MGFLQRAVRYLALRNPRFDRFYGLLASPRGAEYAEFLKERGDFYSIGDNCWIDRHAVIEDRPYIRIGNNVRIATCMILGHDGSVNMINRAYGLRLDNVGKVDIRDNVYVGYGAIILPGVTIGPNAIVCAGSLVRANVKEGDVVAGVPAKAKSRLDVSVEILKARNERLPWRHLIEERNSDFDPEFEPELVRMRVKYFYGEGPKDG
jgi:acetyltransferase-like isoleucine patch superfamily enzyme